MRNIIAVAASLAINLSALVAFEHSADQALPQGEVIVTELGFEPVMSIAQAATARADQTAAL